MAIQIQIRRDTAANWASVDPTPAQGELCYEYDTLRMKIGNGTDPYSVLPYWSSGGSSPVLVYRPGGTAGGNVYTDWASLEAVASVMAGLKWVVIDDSITSPALIPAGSWDMSSTRIIGYIAGSKNTQLQLEDGCTFSALEWFEDLTVTNNNTTTVCFTVPAGGHRLTLVNTSVLANPTAVEMVFSSVGLYLAMRDFASLGGATPLMRLFGSSVVLDVQSRSFITADKIFNDGFPFQVASNPGFYWDASGRIDAQSGFNYFGTFTQTMLDEADSVAYNNISSGLVSTEVQGAIDELALKARSYANMFVYQPGGTAGGNVFTNFGLLLTAVNQANGLRTIVLDDTYQSPIDIPLMTVPFNPGVHLFAPEKTVATTIRLGLGSDMRGVTQFSNLQIVHNAGDVASSFSGVENVVLDNCYLACNSTGTFWQLAGGARLNLKMYRSTIDVTGNQPIYFLAAASIVVFLFDGSNFESDIVNGPAGTITLNQDPSSSVSTNQPSFSGSVNVNVTHWASKVDYNPAAPAAWPSSPTSAGNALDMLVTRTRQNVPTFIFQPGGVATENVYTNWATMMAVVATVNGPKRIIVDDSATSPAVIPTGVWNMTEVSLEGRTNSVVNTLCDVADGVGLTGLRKVGNGLTLNNIGLSAPIALGANSRFDVFNGALLTASAAAPLINVTGGTAYLFFLLASGTAGANRVIHAASGGLGLFIGEGVGLPEQTLSGVAGTTGFASILNPGGNWSTPVTNWLGNPWVVALGGEAQYEAYSNVVSGLLATQVQAAIDELAATKQGKALFNAGTDYNANYSSYRTRSIAGTGGHRFTFAIPPDFNALTKLVLIGIPISGAGGVGKDIDLTSEYGAIGEPYNNHTESDVGSTYDLGTDDDLIELDISSVFSSPSAGDYCAVFVDHNAIGGTVHYLGVRLEYT